MNDQDIRRALHGLDQLPVASSLPQEVAGRARRRRHRFMALVLAVTFLSVAGGVGALSAWIRQNPAQLAPATSDPRIWIEVAPQAELQEEGVIYLSDHGVFLVHGPERPVALSALSPHGDELVKFCRSSQMFEAPGHGEKFDRFGHYFGGPAPRSMDRVAVRVRDGIVEIAPARVTEGPPRHHPRSLQPEGEFCSGGIGQDRETEPGFIEPVS